VQNPSAYNSIVGMVATQGLVSRSGIVPRGPTQDRAGPMARSVYDVAALLSVIAGWDAEDGDTLAAMPYFPRSDWSKLLGAPDLKGKRIGVMREMLDNHPIDDEVKAIFEQALADMRKAGAIIVDPVMTGLNLRVASSNATIGTSHPRLGPVDLPYELIPATNGYLQRLGPKRPWQKLEDMLVKVGPAKLSTEYYKALEFNGPETYPDYLSRQKLRAAVSGVVANRIAELQLDAVVHPYQSAPPPPWDTSKDKYAGTTARTNNLTSATGLPGVIMPAGYTGANLPVALQFVTQPFNDLTLLQVAYGYEQVSKKRVPPALTPALPGEKFTY
jgi:amidase